MNFQGRGQVSSIPTGRETSEQTWPWLTQCIKRRFKNQDSGIRNYSGNILKVKIEIENFLTPSL